MRILITFAMREEFAPWLKGSGFRPVAGDGAETFRKREGAIEVIALVTGVGPANAVRALAVALAGQRHDLVISSGVAGGLRPEHRPGAVLVARAVRCRDDGREIAPAPEWVERAGRLGARAAVFVTSSRVAVTTEEKRRLGASADAVEMESFAVLAEAAARGIPAVAIRAVNDPMEVELPFDFNRVLDDRGRVRAAPLAGAIARRPAAVAELLRLARETRRAAAVLAEFLDRFVILAGGIGRAQEVGSQAAR